ncbi:hypothetical protein GZZ44_10555 [Klebsiella aerogenes]|uniref:hypothetical protein n=1 Tax=Klebsiella aerogenes TaxID=548 RepID=UPI00190E60E8|nr:hypothetical protein [Klebsiella aerogenes]MBK0633388.1 hypothetical protein [Klebsiella aerogenes]
MKEVKTEVKSYFMNFCRFVNVSQLTRFEINAYKHCVRYGNDDLKDLSMLAGFELAARSINS